MPGVTNMIRHMIVSDLKQNPCFICNFANCKDPLCPQGCPVRKRLVSLSHSRSPSPCGFSSLLPTTLPAPHWTCPCTEEGGGGWEEDGRVPSCTLEMLYPSVFLPGVGNMPLQRGSSCTAAPSSPCHALPLICTVCSSCLGHDTSETGCVFHKSVSDRKSRFGVAAPAL